MRPTPSRYLTLITLCITCMVFKTEGGDGIEMEGQKPVYQIRRIAESNVAAVSAVTSLKIIATISASFEPDQFDGLKSRNSRIEFQSSGAKYLFRVRQQTLPEQNGTPDFVCVFDGELWGRFEEDQHRILYISKVDESEKVALRGTNPLWLPYLPLFYNETERFPFKEIFTSHLASTKSWDAFLQAAFNGRIEIHESFGRLIVVSAKLPGSDGSPASSLLMSFSEENGFFPVKWKWSRDDGFETEYSVEKIKIVPSEKSGLNFYFAQKAHMIQRKNHLVISTSELEIESLEINQQTSDDSFLVPVEAATSIIDLNEDVAIPVPR